MEYVDLLNCMRCGMCLPSCPTYKETFRETASPRGRVALMRKIMDGDLDVNERLSEYLALCIDCQACASACPCGVNAGSLVADFTCETKAKKGLSYMENLVLRKLLPHPDRLETATVPLRLYSRTGLQKLVRTIGVTRLLPDTVQRMESLLPEIPAKPLRRTIAPVTPAVGEQTGEVAFFLGCVMSLIFAGASYATVQLLTRAGYTVHTPKDQKCCGAPNMLTGDKQGLLDMAEYNVQLFNGLGDMPVVTDCGGCGAELKKYGKLGADDASRSFSSRVKDISQILADSADRLKPHMKPLNVTVTYHDACHIAHAQGIRKQPRDLLKLVPGLKVVEMADADACCGSGGTYNLKQPEMSDKVLKRKIDSIRATGAQYLVSANPGCLLQLKAAMAEAMPEVKVIHLTELLLMSMEA